MTLSRRQFVQSAGVAGLGLLAECWRFDGTARRKQTTPRARIGFLGAAVASSQTEITAAFREGLTEYGHVEGRDIAIEWRFSDGAFLARSCLTGNVCS
jgi:hypothetical protein